MRLLVALLTVFGGVLSLSAAILILARSVKARRHERAIAAMHDEFDRRGKQYDTAFWAYEEVLRHKASEAVPVAPYGGIERNELADQLQSWYRTRHKELLGYEPGQRPPVQELSTRDALVAELSAPAILAGIGVTISTVASVWSLYLPS
jgi:hypothetical protein